MKEFGFCGLCLIIVEGEVNLKIGGTDYCGRAKGFIRAKKKKKKKNSTTFKRKRLNSRKGRLT